MRPLKAVVLNPGRFFRRHLAMFIDNVYRHSWGVDAPGFQWAEARDAEKCLAMHRSPPNRDLFGLLN